MKTFTYTINHPTGTAIMYFGINRVEHNRNTLQRNTTESADGYTVKGTIQMDVPGDTIDIKIGAVGEPNYGFTYNIKYNNKNIFDDDKEVVIDNDRRVDERQPNVLYVK